MKNNRKVHVKWAGPNSPLIRMMSDDRRLYLNKEELVHLMQEIEEFIAYYKEDFSEGKINIKDEPYEPIDYSYSKQNGPTKY